MNFMEVIVHANQGGLKSGIQEGKHYLIDRNSIWFGNGGNSYGSVYDMHGNYISDMNLKCFTSV